MTKHKTTRLRQAETGPTMACITSRCDLCGAWMERKFTNTYVPYPACSHPYCLMNRLDSLDVGWVPESGRRRPDFDVQCERYNRRDEDSISARYHNVDFKPESDRGRNCGREQDRNRDPPRPSSRPRDRDARGRSRHRETERKRPPSAPQGQAESKREPSPAPRPNREPLVDTVPEAERNVTPEQKAAVLRILRCQPTAFYEILELPKTCTDAEVKKTYRKLSLLTHPDKNGQEQADEAFKMVGRAFAVLGDKEKREKYDRIGMDPDDRMANMKAQARAHGDNMREKREKYDRLGADPSGRFATAQARAEPRKGKRRKCPQYGWVPVDRFATRNEPRAAQNPFAGFAGRRVGGGDRDRGSYQGGDGLAFTFNNDGAGDDPLGDDIFKRRRERTFTFNLDSAREDTYGADVFGDDTFRRRRPRMPSSGGGNSLDDDVYQGLRMPSYIAPEMDEVDRMMQREELTAQFMDSSSRYGRTAPEKPTGFNNYPVNQHAARPAPTLKRPTPSTTKNVPRTEGVTNLPRGRESRAVALLL